MTSNPYEIPKWAGKPAPGLHLDVVKDGKLIQKLLIDEKKCYLFGRNPNQCDFCIDHSSCSRVHSALVYHKHLERAFLVDLGSTHGTFIGNVRLEPNKPTQLPTDSTFHFGASTRYYTIREKPKTANVDGERNEGDQLTLPEDELELDNLTEYNTANNKRISMLGIVDEAPPRKRKNRSITFKEEEDVINPEDIDPTVGKFRNLVQTAVIPAKRQKISDAPMLFDDRSYNVLRPGASRDHSSTASHKTSYNPLLSNSMSIKLGIQLPNPTPDIGDDEVIGPEPPREDQMEEFNDAGPSGMKKYAKEAWPGKKPGLL